MTRPTMGLRQAIAVLGMTEAVDKIGRGTGPAIEGAFTVDALRAAGHHVDPATGDVNGGDGYDVCEWHPDVLASGTVRVSPEGGPTRWVPACDSCADGFEPGDWRPLR